MVTRPVVVGIDLGTSAVKAVVLDDRGTELGECAAGTGSGAASSGVAGSDVAASGATAEGDTDRWWAATCEAVTGALAAAARLDRLGRPSVQGVGLAGQMHGLIALDARGEPVRAPITWMDARSASLLPELSGRAAPYLGELLNPPAPGLTAAIAYWLNRVEPAVLSRARSLVQPKDWLGSRLTGEVVTDPTDASATGLWHFGEGAWHKELSAAVGISDDLLPPVRAGHDGRGPLRACAAAGLGLSAGTPVAVGYADTAASQLGRGVPVGPRTTTLTLGTGAQLCQVLPAEPARPAPGLLALAGPGVGQHYLLAGAFSCGLALDWARRLSALTWPGLLERAFRRPAIVDGPLCVPFLAGERMLPGGAALAASWTGVRLADDGADLLRALVEGVAYTVRLARDLVRADPQSTDVEECTAVGGGARDARIRQLLADVLGVPVRSPARWNSSARGAAHCAAVAAGWCAGPEEALRLLAQPGTVVDPDPEAVRVHEVRYARFVEQVRAREPAGADPPAST